MKVNYTFKKKRSLKNVVEVAEFLKNIFEVIAIILGGIWAIYNFNLKDKPKLAANINNASYIVDYDFTPPNMFGVYYRILAENKGDFDFYIDSIHIKYWIVSNAMIIKNKIFNVEHYMSSIQPDSCISNYSPSNPFVSLFPPKKIIEHFYSFFLDTSSKTGIIFQDVLYLHHNYPKLFCLNSGHTFG